MFTFDEYFAIETRKTNTMQQYDKKKIINLMLQLKEEE